MIRFWKKKLNLSRILIPRSEVLSKIDLKISYKFDFFNVDFKFNHLKIQIKYKYFFKISLKTTIFK